MNGQKNDRQKFHYFTPRVYLRDSYNGNDYYWFKIITQPKILKILRHNFCEVESGFFLTRLFLFFFHRDEIAKYIFFKEKYRVFVFG